jgi:hypothetical protein
MLNPVVQYTLDMHLIMLSISPVGKNRKSDYSMAVILNGSYSIYLLKIGRILRKKGIYF